jgi:DHA1 family bicyclomycin/chloramphenicol resistance-like MFS transporter
MKLAIEQAHFGPRSFLACILLINVLVILAIDMYAPALSSMQREFEVSASFLNLTMFLFILVSAVAIVVAAPLSDKFGRKPVLVGSSAIFAVSSALCAVSPSVGVLTVFRMGEAIGFGGITTLATAIIKDAFSKEDGKLGMTMLQSLIIVGPALAPFIGSFALSLWSWRGIFWMLALFGSIATVLSLLVSETLPSEHRLTGTVGNSLKSTLDISRHLARKPHFLPLALFLGVAGVPYFAFIGSVSYTLLDEFGMSYLGYSCIYAAVCLLSVVAPFIYMRISSRFSSRTICIIAVVVVTISCGLMFTIGQQEPWLYFAALSPYIIIEGIVRPMVFIELLDQPPSEVAAASAFLNFLYTVLSSFGTVLGTLPWPSYVIGLGIILGLTAVALLVLLIAGTRKVPPDVAEQHSSGYEDAEG